MANNPSKKTGKANTNNVIKNVGTFPTPLVPQKVKMGIDYGYQYANAMYQNRYGHDNSYDSNKRSRFKTNKMYRNGTQDMSQYLDIVKLNGDNTTVNLNLSPIAVIPYFVDSMIEEICDASWQINAKTSDAIGSMEEDSIKEYLVQKLMQKPYMKRLAEQLGVMPPEEATMALESVEEIEIYMSLNYKSMVEMAAEIGATLVFQLNDYEEIRRQLVDDIITHGIAVNHVSCKSGKGIEIERIEPEDFVYSYSKTPDFKNIQHGGHMFTITISSLRNMCPDLTEEQLEEISESASSNNNPEYHARENAYNNGTGYYDYVYDSFQVTCMRFEFLSEDKIVHEKTEKNGYTLMSRQKDTYKPSSDKKRTEKTITNVYTGIWILGTEYILNYGLKENIARPNSALTKAKIGYNVYAPNIYKNNYKSIVERMRPFADQIQINHIKIQQLIAAARPNGLLIEVGSLKQVALDGVNVNTPLELLQVYNEQGHMFYNALDQQGQATGQPPFRELQNGIDFNGLQALITNYNHNLQMLRDVSGFIPERSGVTKSDQLVGVTEMAIKASLNSIGFIKNAWINITRATADQCLMLLGDIIKFEPSIYSKALDGLSEEILMGFVELPYRELGIVIEVEPDQAQRLALEQAMMVEVQQGNLQSEIVHQIRQVKNLSLAYQMIAMYRKRAQKMRMEESQANIQAQMESQSQATQMAAQMEERRIQLETQAKIAIIEAEKEKEAYITTLKASYGENVEIAKQQLKIMQQEDAFQKQMQKEQFKEGQKNSRDEANRQFRAQQASSSNTHKK